MNEEPTDARRIEDLRALETSGHFWRRLALCLVTAALVAGPGRLLADPGGPTTTVFATSKIYFGDLGGLTGADSICQGLADDAGLPGTFLAWLGQHALPSPAERFTRSTVPYALVDGTVVANDWSDLTDGTLQAPIDRDEKGGLSSFFAWGNVSADGTLTPTPIRDCWGWTSDFPSPEFGARVGDVGATDGTWTDWGPAGCGTLPFSLYCFEQPLTEPPPPTPPIPALSPIGVSVLAAALLGVALALRSRGADGPR